MEPPKPPSYHHYHAAAAAASAAASSATTFEIFVQFLSVFLQQTRRLSVSTFPFILINHCFYGNGDK